MENRSIIYQVAHPQHTFNQRRNVGRSPFAPLPFPIAEEDSPAPFKPHPQSCNIFRAPLEAPPYRVDGLPPTGYHAVGSKEVKSYLGKVEKRRRYMNSMVKRSTQSNLSLSRTSQVRVPQQRYLTKEEVLTHRQLATLNHSHLEEPYLTNALSQPSAQNSTINTNCSSLGLFCPQTNADQFSLRKVIKKMNKYKRGWEKQSAERAATGPPRQRSQPQFKSILLDVDKYRQRVEEKERTFLRNEREAELQPKLWGKVLRNSNSHLSLRPHKMEQLVRGGLTSSGRGKLGKEMSWIEEKDRQGHFFKIHSESK